MTIPEPPAAPTRERPAAPVQRPDEVGVTTTRIDGVPKVQGEFEYSSRHARRGDAVGRDAAQPAPARGHLVDRHRRARWPSPACTPC